jgi:hypothetical protein
MLYRSRASVVGSMPHSYGFELYFVVLTRMNEAREDQREQREPVATTTKIAIGT